MEKAKIVFRYTPLNWSNGIVGLGSWLIRKITDCPYDHSERMVGDRVYSGTQKGVRYKSYFNYKNHYKGQQNFIYDCYMPNGDDAFLVEFEKYKGTKYDYWSLVCHLIYYITGRLFSKYIWIGKTNSGDDKFYCTEFIAKASGLDNWYLYDPKKLLHYVRENRLKLKDI